MTQIIKESLWFNIVCVCVQTFVSYHTLHYPSHPVGLSRTLPDQILLCCGNGKGGQCCSGPNQHYIIFV